MGPPEILPSGLTFLYITPATHSANLVDMPKKPAMINQNVAPGPPIEITIATPAILPIPTVPDTAVDKA